MRFNEETFSDRELVFPLYQDVYARWLAEIDGYKVAVGFDFARGFDPHKERIAVIEAARDYIDHRK